MSSLQASLLVWDVPGPCNSIKPSRAFGTLPMYGILCDITTLAARHLRLIFTWDFKISSATPGGRKPLLDTPQKKNKQGNTNKMNTQIIKRSVTCGSIIGRFTLRIANILMSSSRCQVNNNSVDSEELPVVRKGKVRERWGKWNRHKPFKRKNSYLRGRWNLTITCRGVFLFLSMAFTSAPVWIRSLAVVAQGNLDKKQPT